MRQPRLLDQFKPEKYQLEISLDDNKQSFSGNVKIFGSVPSPRKTIELHALNIDIGSATINDLAAKIEIVKDEQKIVLSVDEEISDNAIIVAEFSAQISETMEGIYPSDYTENDIKKRLISTQFESHHAREAFPCIDEPAAKAVFELTLDTPDDNSTVLGNTPVKDQTTASGRVITCF
jgi:aminopeptidase N